MLDKISYLNGFCFSNLNYKMSKESDKILDGKVKEPIQLDPQFSLKMKVFISLFFLLYFIEALEELALNGPKIKHQLDEFKYGYLIFYIYMILKPILRMLKSVFYHIFCYIILLLLLKTIIKERYIILLIKDIIDKNIKNIKYIFFKCNKKTFKIIKLF